jgi:hypothetical protein
LKRKPPLARIRSESKGDVIAKIAKQFGLLLAAALLLLWPPAPAAAAEKGPLDGKTFPGEMMEKGKAKGDQDTFVFKDGKFRSTACDAYGFTETAYAGAVSDVATTFEAVATSPKEGTMKWKGTVKGDSVEGTAVWTKNGQADVIYTFKGALKK